MKCPHIAKTVCMNNTGFGEYHPGSFQLKQYRVSGRRAFSKCPLYVCRTFVQYLAMPRVSYQIG
jgi:hypothetical protein